MKTFLIWSFIALSVWSSQYGPVVDLGESINAVFSYLSFVILPIFELISLAL